MTHAHRAVISVAAALLFASAAWSQTPRRTRGEERKVVGEAIGLDTTTTTLATNMAPLVIENLPTGRNYSSIVQVAPGISSDATPENKDQASITVYGSSGAENAFYIDGV